MIEAQQAPGPRHQQRAGAGEQLQATNDGLGRREMRTDAAQAEAALAGAI